MYGVRGTPVAGLRACRVSVVGTSSTRTRAAACECFRTLRGGEGERERVDPWILGLSEKFNYKSLYEHVLKFRETGEGSRRGLMGSEGRESGRLEDR